MPGIDIPSESLEDWLAVLKPYQREQMAILVAANEPESAAEKWVSTIGHANIAHFGGISNPKPFWSLLKKEFHEFLCNDEAYKKEKAELAKHGSLTKTMLVGAISSAVGATIGVAATVITPAVVVLLFLVGKMTLNAYCKMPDLEEGTPKPPGG